ncbi:MAG TPA: hypothetical protein DD435_04640 [Cyanobacteria bacterium UBA8530]|nr:hypothetical protein [Cyanobacteria bacterium UBA8530]
MKSKKAILLALSLGIGLAYALPGLGATDFDSKDGDQKSETTKRVYSGTKDGKAGTFIEFTKKTSRYVVDQDKVAAIDAFRVLTGAPGTWETTGREPTQAELDAWVALNNAAGAYDERKYLDANIDVKGAENMGWFSSGIVHYLTSGQNEGRNPDGNLGFPATMPGFDQAYYLAQHPEVAQAIADGKYQNALQHFAEVGYSEGFKANAAGTKVFDEAAYLAANPGVAAVIADGRYPNALEVSLMGSYNQGPKPVVTVQEVTAMAQAVAAGKVTLATALASINSLKAIGEQNKNSDYLSEIPKAYLDWDPTKGPLTLAQAQEVGALGQGWEPRFVDAYQGLNVDPTTKIFQAGPLQGQKLAADYPSALAQLKNNGYITQDWNFDTLLADLGGQAVLDQYAAARGNSTFWTANLFVKQNMADPTFIQRYSQQLITNYEKKRLNPSFQWPGDVWTSWYYDSGWYNAERAKGLTPDQVQDEMVRYWMSVDGVGAFSSGFTMGAIGPVPNGRGGLDADILALENTSAAAKLVAQSKALRAAGATALADAKIVEARNLILLDGNNHDPLVLDLNHNGKVDVTGASSAKYRNAQNKKFVSDASVKFDLLANNSPIQTEWIKGGDGFLVDNRKNSALNAIMAGKPLTGANLFGDVEGMPGGFLKLASAFDIDNKYASLKDRLSKGYGVLKAKELESLMVWVDNGDGVAKTEELKTLAELGITEMGVMPQVKKENEELFEQSYFVQDGKKYVMQEVWFMGK